MGHDSCCVRLSFGNSNAYGWDWQVILESASAAGLARYVFADQIWSGTNVMDFLSLRGKSAAHYRVSRVLESCTCRNTVSGLGGRNMSGA